MVLNNKNKTNTMRTLDRRILVLVLVLVVIPYGFILQPVGSNPSRSCVARRSQLGVVGHEHRLHVGDEDREVQEAMQQMMADPQAMQKMMADPQAMQRTPHEPQRGELQLPSVLAPLDSLGQQSPSGMSW